MLMRSQVGPQHREREQAGLWHGRQQKRKTPSWGTCPPDVAGGGWFAFGFNILLLYAYGHSSYLRLLSQFLQAAVTKYYRDVLLTVLKAGNQRLRCQQGWG